MKPPSDILQGFGHRLKQPGRLMAALALLLLAFPTRAQVLNCVKIQCPADQVVECTGSPGTTVNFTVLATTGCGRIVSLVSGTPAPSGAASLPLRDQIRRTEEKAAAIAQDPARALAGLVAIPEKLRNADRKSTRLNSSHT